MARLITRRPIQRRPHHFLNSRARGWHAKWTATIWMGQKSRDVNDRGHAGCNTSAPNAPLSRPHHSIRSPSVASSDRQVQLQSRASSPDPQHADSQKKRWPGAPIGQCLPCPRRCDAGTAGRAATTLATYKWSGSRAGERPAQHLMSLRASPMDGYVGNTRRVHGLPAAFRAFLKMAPGRAERQWGYRALGRAPIQPSTESHKKKQCK